MASCLKTQGELPYQNRPAGGDWQAGSPEARKSCHATRPHGIFLLMLSELRKSLDDHLSIDKVVCALEEFPQP